MNLEQFQQQLAPGIQVITYYGPHPDNLQHAQDFLQRFQGIDHGDFLEVVETLGYFEISLPWSVNGRPSSNFMGMCMPEGAMDLHDEFFDGTELPDVIPVMDGGGGELLVWACFDGQTGVYLCNKVPFMDPSKYHFVAKSLKGLLFSTEGIERLAQVNRWIFTW